MDIETIINNLGATDILLVYGGTVLVLVFIIIALAVRKKKVVLTEQVAVNGVQILEDGVNPHTEELENQIHDLQSQIASLKNALMEAEAKCTTLSGGPEVAAQELSVKIENLFAEKQKLEEQLKISETEKKLVDNLRNEIQSLKDVVVTTEAEKKKLKDKLEEVEEEIEDLEDEIDKKSRKHKEEISQKDKAIADLQASEKELTTKIQHKDQMIKEQGDELSVKDDSLDFVREILKAKDVANKEKFYQKVDSLVEYIEDEVQKVVKEAPDTSMDESLFDSDLIHWKQIVKKDWLKNKRAVAFVGEFSAGKTSIVNKILESSSGTKVELPVSTKATTAIPTYISENSQSKGATFQFFTPDNRLKGLTEEAFKKVNKEILDQVDGVSALIKYFIMTCNNPQLKNLSILDTPGFNSNDKEDTERTIGVINECDALFWIFDVNVGEVNKSSLNVIKKNLRKPLYVVINKVDTKAQGEVEKVESHIKTTFRNAGITVQDYIWYSKKEPIEKIMCKLKEISQTNNTDDYLNRLMKCIEQIKSKYEAKCSAQSKKKRLAKDKSEKLYDDYLALVENIGNKCERARGIPQYKERIFRGDIYQMDYDSGQRLKNMLNDVSDNLVKAAHDKFVEYGEAMKTLEQKEKEYGEIQAKKRRLDNCANDLKKRIDGLEGGK